MTGDRLNIDSFFLNELERSTDTGCWSYDIAKEELFWSDQTYKIHVVDKATKLDVSEAIHFYHPDDREEISRAFKNCIEYGDEFRLRLRIITTENKVVYVESFGRPIYEKNKITMVFGTFKNISKDIFLLKKAKYSTIQYQALLESINKCFIVAETDKKGIISSVNENFVKISGYSREELIGEDHRIVNSGVHPKNFFSDLWGTLSDNEIWNGLICNKSKSGDLYWVETYIFPRITNGEYDGYITIRYDVTEAHIQSLELVRERENAELAAQLAAVGEISAGIAHEINNPLIVIMGKTSLLQSKASDSENVKKISLDIENASDRIRKIIKGLHHLAQKSRGGEHQTHNLISIINYTFDFCSEALKTNFIDLKLESEKGDILISCDEVKISQVLLNIINNARDAIVESEVKDKWIRIEVKPYDSSVEVYVYDSGPGVKVEDREKVLKPFYTTKEVGKGTGLGLSLIQRFLSEHNGELKIISDSRGNGFMFKLPVVKA